VSDTDGLPFAHGGAPLTAVLRSRHEDFEVEELPGFDPSGQGEHALLWTEKRGLNTADAAKALARHAGVGEVAIGYAGMKDRHGLTRQRFSVHLPGRPDPDWSALEGSGLRVLSASRHARKLPRGALAGNRFRITLRDVAGDRVRADAVLARMAAHGVPNYFGEQRFGRGGGNRQAVRAMFQGRRVGRDERGILLSAARSEIFNGVLAVRVADGTWNRAIAGDVFQLDGRGSIFGPVALDELPHDRVASGDVHPTGPLWGTGGSRATEAAWEIEASVAGGLGELVDGLAKADMASARRPLRLRVHRLAAEWQPDGALMLAFELDAGGYATTVIRELAHTSDGSRGAATPVP